jgi:lysophospholipase L1-like esterase
MATRLTKLARAARLVAVWLVAIVVVLYINHWRWRRNLPRTLASTAIQPATTGLSPSLLRSIGWFYPSKRRDVRHMFAHKSPPTIRIVALGDSFTFGSEVVDGHDFPSLLRDRLRADGFANVEVHNLGGPGYGLSQTVRLYEELRPDVQPDFVLFGPRGLWMDRDLSFVFASAGRDALHGRFVLDGDGVRFVDVVGADHEAAFDAYYRFFPSLQYLRYDKATPPVLQALLPADRRIANPFYYSRLDDEAEADALLQRLLFRIGQDGRQILAAAQNQAMRDMAEGALGASAVAVSMDPPSTALYLRGTHFSANGYSLIADGFHQMLRGTAPIRREVVSIDDVLSTTPAATPVGRARVELDGAPALTLLEREHVFNGNVDVEGELSGKSVVAVVWGEQSLVDATLIPLEAGLPVGASADVGGVAASVAASSISNWTILRLPEGLRSRDFDVRVGGQLLGRIESGSLTAAAGHSFFFRPRRGDLLDVGKLAADGDVTLVSSGGRVRLGRYRKKTALVDWPPQRLRQFLAPGPQGAMVITR